MREAVGNIWSMEGDGICITTNGFVKANGEAVMGRGIAKQARELYPHLSVDLGSAILSKGNHVFPFGYITNVDDFDLLISFPVKHHWREKADIALIERSSRELMDFINTTFWENILLPRPGCGNGSLRWKDVKPVIEPILDDRIVVVSYEP